MHFRHRHAPRFARIDFLEVRNKGPLVQRLLPLELGDLSVDVDSHCNVEFWSRALSTDTRQIRLAVKVMGTNAEDVRYYVSKARMNSDGRYQSWDRE